MYELVEADIDQAISIIESADFDKLSIEDFEEYLTPLFRGYRVAAPRFEKGIYLYRGRICEKPQNVREIIYPPSENVTNLGRINNIGESFFYAANAKAVPFFELNVKKGQYLTLSKWKTTDKLCVNYIGFSKECKEYLNSFRELDNIYNFVKFTRSQSDLNTRVHDYLSLKFSTAIEPGKEAYNKLTIAISRKLFNSEIFSGLLYPTIAMAGNADNIVLKKDFVDRCLKLVSVEFIDIKDTKEMEYGIQTLDSATKVNEKGDLLWANRTLQWQLKKQGQEIIIKSEGGEWIAYDNEGNPVDPE